MRGAVSDDRPYRDPEFPGIPLDPDSLDPDSREDLKLNPNDTVLCTTLAAYLAKSGDARQALLELSKLGELKGSDPLFKASLVYEIAGDRDHALGALERAILAGYSMHEIVNEPELSLLRSDSRYATIAGLSAKRKKE